MVVVVVVVAVVVLEDVVVLDVGIAEVVGDADTAPLPPVSQVPDSSPRAAKLSMFLIRTAALLDTPATPVGVPVTGCGLSDRKQYYYLWQAV